MTINSIPVKRGCGTREGGGIYAESGVGEGGRPLEDFMHCPPIPIDAESMGLSPVGVKLIQAAGAWHIFDWIGEQFYPNVADFLEEVRRFGLSRRLPKTLEFSKINHRSKIICLHARAHVTNYREYVSSGWVNIGYNRCPKGDIAQDGTNHNTDKPPKMCAGVFYQDVEQGQHAGGALSRLVRRSLPAFDYQAACRPEGVTPQYRLAAFAAFPRLLESSRIAKHPGPHVIFFLILS